MCNKVKFRYDSSHDQLEDSAQREGTKQREKRLRGDDHISTEMIYLKIQD